MNAGQQQLTAKKTDILKVYNALIAIPVDKGEHIIELKYFLPKLPEGIIISVISLIFLCFFCYKKE